jgi:hypothetical protein
MSNTLIQEIMSLGDLPEFRAIQIVNLVLDHIEQGPEGEVSQEHLWTAEGDQKVIVMSFDDFLAGKPAGDLFDGDEE